MEARIKKLFSRKFSLSNSDLKGHSYDNAIAQQPPVRGTLPVTGNGNSQTDIAEQVSRGRGRTRLPARDSQKRISLISNESAAAPPDIPRSPQQQSSPRWNAPSPTWEIAPRSSKSIPRPRTASAADPKKSKQSGRTFSGFSMKNSPLKKHKQSTSNTNPTSFDPAITSFLPPLPKPARLEHSRNKSSYVDIIAASSLKQHASGRKDYGEDVADRNMDDHSRQASDSMVNFNSPEFSYMRSIYSRDRGTPTKAGMDHSRVGSAWNHILKRDDDSNGNDDAHTLYNSSPLTPHPVVTRISSDGRAKSDRAKRTLSPKGSLTDDQFSDTNSIYVATTRQTSIVSTYQPSGLPKPSYPSPPSGKPGVPTRSEARTFSINSQSSRKTAATMRETMRDGPSSSKRVPRKSLDNNAAAAPLIQGSSAAARQAVRDETLVAPPSRGRNQAMEATAAAAAVAAVTGKENNKSRAGSTSRSEKKHLQPLEQKPTTMMGNRPLTPPMSPDTPGKDQGHAAIPVVTPKNNNNSSRPSSTNRSRPSSTNRSRASSAAYSPFPKPAPVRASVSRQASDSFNRTTNNEYATDANASKHDSGQSRAGHNIEGSSQAPSLKGVVDLNNTVDTTVSTRSLPAVTHETIQPQVHNIREEQITREIHTHDVFHRILPIVDVEVLPTKHYVRNSDGGLTEIPASAVPGRQGHWQVEESPRSSTTSMSSDSVAPPAISAGRANGTSVSARQRGSSFSEKPVMTSTRTSTLSSGAPKTESIWRHPPTEETGGRKTGQTVPLNMNTHDGASDIYDDSESSRSRRSEDSALLFRDTGYGGGISGYGGGMLPGLMERSPVVEHVAPESEAVKALRRRQEEMEMRRRLENMGLR